MKKTIINLHIELFLSFSSESFFLQDHKTHKTHALRCQDSARPAAFRCAFGCKLLGSHILDQVSKLRSQAVLTLQLWNCQNSYC